MAFQINWPKFSTEIIDDIKIELSKALNSGDTPSTISGDIAVQDLDLGSVVSFHSFFNSAPTVGNIRDWRTFR
jgi:hypothetical protein